MQFLFASGQVSVFGDICQQRIGASLHYYYFIYFSAYSRSLLTLKAETLFSLFISLLCFFCEGAITPTGMLGPLWRCAALSGSIIASVLMRCWNGMGLRGVSRVSAPQLVCSGLYSAGDSLFPLFFFGCYDHACCSCFFIFVCVYYYLHIACFNALSLCRLLLSLSFSFCKCVRRCLLFFFFFKNKQLD